MHAKLPAVGNILAAAAAAAYVLLRRVNTSAGSSFCARRAPRIHLVDVKRSGAAIASAAEDEEDGEEM